MTEKRLGKITRATFGFGGYQDAMIGLNLEFGGDGWGVGTFHGAWGNKRSQHTKWTEEDRIKQLGETCLKLRDLLIDAKENNVNGLIGTPVEVEFEGNCLKDYRILTEVL